MRLHDWQTRLATVMREAQPRPFAWGAHDCVTFSAACVEAVTGADPIADVRWADERQALRLLADGGGLLELARSRLGAELASPLMAQPGDVGLCMQGERPGLCVCGGVNWHMPGVEGLATLAADQVLRAWRCEGA